jgi:hypothetical protein
MTRGSLGAKGRAPHLRLTELGYMRDLPTRDFMHWNGNKFSNRTEPPLSRKLDHGAPESWTIPTFQKAGAPKSQSSPENGSIVSPKASPENGSITNTTTTKVSCSSVPVSPELADLVRRRERRYQSRRVSDAAANGRYGTVRKGGPEVSEVEWDDGKRQHITNEFIKDAPPSLDEGIPEFLKRAKNQ